jgi:AraC-like DNA-binding protein
MSARSGHIWLEPDFLPNPAPGWARKARETAAISCGRRTRQPSATPSPAQSNNPSSCRPFSRCRREWRAAQERLIGSTRQHPSRSQNVIQVREYIDRHYARPLTVSRLARLAGLSPYHFIRAFRAHTGQTPHQYLRARRIERAKELLVTTPMPVTEICDAVGFHSLGSFSSLFRKLTGETPAAFRAARRRSVRIPTCFVRMYRADR